MSNLSIGEVAARAGLATSAIRYYERVGLLPLARRASGRRRYDPSVIERLAVIATAKALGFTLAEIKVLVLGLGGRETYARRLQSLAEEKLPEVEATLERARIMRRLLRSAGKCRCVSLDQCVGGLERAGLL